MPQPKSSTKTTYPRKSLSEVDVGFEIFYSFENMSKTWAKRICDCTGLEPTNPENFRDSLICGLMVLFDRQGMSANELEADLYFYHTDHTSTALSTGLGSSSWITVRQAHCNADATGSAYQHMQSLPFGEDYIDQRTSSWTAPYRFTGKPACRRGRERDSETGWDYFGARYLAYRQAGYDSELSVWLSVDPLADKYPGMSAYMYTAGNPVMLVDPDGRDIFIYYIGPKFSFTGFFGHTAIGVNNGGDSKISYYPAYGSIAVWIKHEHINPDGGVYYTYTIDESKTMIEYAKDGEYVVRMRVKLPDAVEKNIKEGIDDYIKSGGTTTLGDGAYCTLQVADIIYNAFIEEGYSKEVAQEETNKIIYFRTPENPSDEEKIEMGVTQYDVYYKDDKERIIFEKYQLKEDVFLLKKRYNLILGSEGSKK